MPAEEETLIAGRGGTVRIDVPSSDPDLRPIATNTPPRKSPVGKIFVVIAALGVLLIVFVIVAILILALGLDMNNTFMFRKENKNITPSNSTPTPDPEKQRLQDELANIQRRLDEQQKNANRPVTPPPAPTPNSPGTVTARVNSPNDGFLALRAAPDADRGQRIAKIPHGDVVTIENCNRNKVTIGARSGRWCLISWNGYEGYVFDAWLIY
jgi:Bacterial SH3 domain